MNNFRSVIEWFKTYNVYYQDADSLYNHKKHWANQIKLVWLVKTV